MSRQDVEHFQSFCRKWINKVVREHFKDLPPGTDGSLDTDSPRGVIRDVCLHKDTDTMTLTIGRMLTWWVEARGLFEDVIYGIPSTDFHETQKFLPQITIYWKESIKDAKLENRYQIKARYTVRWKGDYATKTDIDIIRVKINNIFNKPVTHSFYKGREKWSYYDLEKGYRLIVTARDETEAKDVINKLLEIQGDNPLIEANLGKSTKDKNWNQKETVRVNGELYDKPKQRPIGKVRFVRAEFKVHGMTRDILLTDDKGVLMPGATP